MPNDRIATQPHGSTFQWPKGVTLTALDELVLILPGAIVGESEPIRSAVEGSDKMQVRLEFENDTGPLRFVYIRLQAGMWARVARSCEARLISLDGTPRRISIGHPDLPP